jgi:hypothetical protein
MKKEFVNPTIPLKATIAELRKEIKALKRERKYKDKKNDKIVDLRVKQILEYRRMAGTF